MRILIISIAFAPELIGNAPLVTELATDLAKQGHQLNAWCEFSRIKLWGWFLDRGSVLQNAIIEIGRSLPQ